MFQVLSFGAVIGLMTATNACGTPRNGNVNDETVSRGAVMNSNDGTAGAAEGAPVNQRFATLDDYLSWLRKTQAPVDGSWYEEIRPGVYQLRTGNLRIVGSIGDAPPPPQTFTRAQLEKQFGFTR